MDFSLFKVFIFSTVAILAIFSSLMMVTRKNPIHSALWLIVSFCTMAVIYLMLNAQFIAVAQVMVYAGAIMMLIIFVIMLVHLEKDIVSERRFSATKFVGGFVTVILLLEILLVSLSYQIPGREGVYTPETVDAIGNVKVVGSLLYGQYLFPFEIASILLLVGIVGAVVLVRGRRKTGNEKDRALKAESSKLIADN
ncbi:MAG: NADH-quinone oxidoreductase subunit J [Syntrophales bacterium]|nr:NADH-quinone oxidoreductase subunit J [Syntrophales bacterium]